MVPRSSDTAANRLRRAKSTSSVKSSRYIPPVSEPIDPETARYHALTAASIAMQRHKQQRSTDSRGSCDISRGGDSEANTHNIRYPKPQSIRFGARDNLNSQNQEPYMQSPGSTTSQPTRDSTGHDPAYDAAVEELTPSITQMSGFEDSVPSVPSSYRKLRRAKSMFSTRKRTSKYSDSPHSPHRSYDASDSPGTGHLSKATLRRSKSFFGTGPPQNPQNLRRMQSHDAAIQLAREQFLQNLKTPQSETITSRKPRYRAKPLRKSLRSSSGFGSEYTASSDIQPMENKELNYTESRKSSKSRLFSVSIKNGLRRMFGRSSVTQEQQQAHSAHRARNRLELSDYVNSECSTNFDKRTASIRSMKSSDSFCTSSSRVTSWTDSTATNTMARDSASERNRLGIIQENGDLPEPIPSPSSFHYNDGYSIFRKPFYSEQNNNHVEDIVDSQRVYSALVRHIDESGHQRGGDVTPRATTVRRSVCSPSLSTYSHRTSHSIRHVPSEASMRTIKALPALPAFYRRSPSCRSQISVSSNYPGDSLGLTPQQVAQRNENTGHHRPRQPLHQSKSLFFQPSPRKHSEFPNPLLLPTIPPRGRISSPDDDTGSVIISRPGAMGGSPVSPSVYSRTTSGDTPRRYETKRDLDFSESSDERGTVTILASERLPYRPQKSGGYICSDRQNKGSAEWKSWMSSQMDLIDNSPSGNTPKSQSYRRPNSHYWEDTQINDEKFDENDGESPIKPLQINRNPSNPVSGFDVRPPLLELKSFTQNNFSRPLRLSPATSISLSHTPVQKPSVVVRSQSPLSVHLSPDPDPGSATTTASPDPRSMSKSPDCSPLVYSKTRPTMMGSPVTPTRNSKSVQNKVSIPSNDERDSPTQQPTNPRRLTTAKSLNSMRTRRDTVGINNENSRNARTYTKNNWAALGDIHSTISSKRMVDLFLSDRRRQTGAAENATENAFL
ncbi:hypothetical protein FQN53_001743 [Emmonsiellopsis sp. PD_33]|nr:hypothetical protein FQN53_001743 [Emmonsiellopsis sp. PD_33]